MIQKQHITERELDLFVIDRQRLPEQERKRIEAHLTQCKLCSEHLQTVQQFYGELGTRHEQPPSVKDEQLAEELLRPPARKLLPSDALIERYGEVLEQNKQTLARRFYSYVQIYPMRSAGFATALAAALVLTFLSMRPTRDINPSFARIQNTVLYVYNKTGDVLWTRTALGVEDQPSNGSINVVGSPRSLNLFDIDGDGTNEVLIFGKSLERHSSPENISFARDSIYCFNNDGGLRWQTGCGDFAQFGKEISPQQGYWQVHTIFIVKNDKTSQPQLFAIAGIAPYWPNKLFELDAKNGKELQAYWHAGGLNVVMSQELDVKGRQEILLGGINNAFRRAMITVLDPFDIRGYGPTSEEWKPTNISPGREKYYVLLPWTDLGQVASGTSYNAVSSLQRINEKTFQVSADETIASGNGSTIVYALGQDLAVKSIVAGDNFLVSHERLVKQGKLKSKIGDAYYRELKDSFRYWDGEKFVNHPVMNKNYLNAMKLP